MNLGSSVVIDLSQVQEDTYCQVFFDNFFNSSTLIQKLHDHGLYGSGTAHSHRINMSHMKKDKEMKQVYTFIQPGFQTRVGNNNNLSNTTDNKW